MRNAIQINTGKRKEARSREKYRREKKKNIKTFNKGAKLGIEPRTCHNSRIFGDLGNPPEATIIPLDHLAEFVEAILVF